MLDRIGCVPYVNAVPLVLDFEESSAEADIDVLYEVPSRLPALLDSGEVSAVLVSSFFALTRPELRAAAGVGIVSEGPVASVKLFSKRPFDQIETLSLDASSMTSNALALIVLGERYDRQPVTASQPPHLPTMLETADAAVLIGDEGLRARGDGLHVLDLGEAWTQMTGLPFVWALWVGDQKLTAGLAERLRRASTPSVIESPERLRRCVDRATRLLDWPHEALAEYLTVNVRHDVGERELAGLAAYAEALNRHGHHTQMPEWVGLSQPASL